MDPSSTVSSHAQSPVRFKFLNHNEWFSHSVRAPTPSMSLLADELQDAIEWVGTPSLAFACVPLSFAEMYVAMTYISFVEAMGHRYYSSLSHTI